MDFIVNGKSPKKVNFNQYVCKKVYYKYGNKIDLIFEEVEKKYTILNNTSLAFKYYDQIVRPTEDYGTVDFTGTLKCTVASPNYNSTDVDVTGITINTTEITFTLSDGVVIKYREVNGEYRFDYIPTDGSEAEWASSPTITAINGDVIFTNEGAYNWILDSTTFNISKGSYAFTDVNLSIPNSTSISVSNLLISTSTFDDNESDRVRLYNLSINSIHFSINDTTALDGTVQYGITFTSGSSSGSYTSVHYIKSGNDSGKWQCSTDGDNSNWTDCAVPVVTLSQDLPVDKAIGEWFLNSGKTTADMKDMGIINYNNTKSIFKIVGISYSLTFPLNNIYYDDSFTSNSIVYDRMLVANNQTISYIKVSESGETPTVVYNANGTPQWLDTDDEGVSPYKTVALTAPNSVPADFLGWWIPNTTYIPS